MRQLIYGILLMSLLGCTSKETIFAEDEVVAYLSPYFTFTTHSWQAFVEESALHEPQQRRMIADGERFLALAHVMFRSDESLLWLVDKQHFLPADYAPNDLIKLDSLVWPRVNRAGHELRRESVNALEAMHQQAVREGTPLLVSSTYRSYSRQQDVYAGWVRQLGQVEADRLSAKAGTSQHQLGTVVDFGSINASFTGTKMQQWLEKHAHTYGFSLSYPNGYEAETGYDYESWHYRYLGREALMMQREFFDDLQFQLLTFWHYRHAELQTFWLGKQE
ncbi:M15 family metallopeptidase [Entomospira culicis]|uniref:M15 family metallopeptidase n=1 Tax=Entomospira culicis TaxID=2719989 RepID=A0A968GF17_9SPIO|nr:M15 family metallopeptidase [Entomospira culicis]NIZ18618.1 M15 family metallopeptidase [Entomospira culicis]NIZ68833.1 M15 family metallopeptidase [Entomospira culicis]WDI37427.1 M15 family metallopeptidase [Entomospira culicis]WDI39055.1 M15 family metallopeptidase [Entomospira culicis]